MGVEMRVVGGEEMRVVGGVEMRISGAVALAPARTSIYTPHI
jgi:hypothetical protein